MESWLKEHTQCLFVIFQYVGHQKTEGWEHRVAALVYDITSRGKKTEVMPCLSRIQQEVYGKP